ncbi:TorD/DmsD family molecular chaperone [Elioraea sp.]|uniref:TorD/DmsD family molecular chaperone n=1 Tax=Elioraea sp. TaxID=2185103 RepID=UPI003F700B99
MSAGNVLSGVSAPDRETEAGRARGYALLATLLVRPPDGALLGRLGMLDTDGTALGEALAGLGEAAREARAEAVEREFHELFIGLGRGELLPYASYYLTGFLHERPLAKLRAELAALGIERADGVAEPEDHIATLCEVMAGLIDGSLGHGSLGDGSLGDGTGPDGRIFERHLRPWADRFFADLEQAKAARFYRAVGRLGRVFIGIETEAFALPA